jgi:hypothetical protein
VAPSAAVELSDAIVTAKARVAESAIDLLAKLPTGIRHTILIQKIAAALPDIPLNTIRGSIVGLVEYKPDAVFQPAKGLFQHTMYRENTEPTAADGSSVTPQPREGEFYATFADFLTEDLEECTKCVALGGSLFKDKWGTPDVIGIRKARESDIIKFATEIVTAEIKTDTNGLITAFGQACSYRLFSHRCYLVIPKSAGAEDLARLEALCLTCGLGLVLFDSQDATNPNFSIRVRATRNEPDMFYVNRNLKLVEQLLFD